MLASFIFPNPVSAEVSIPPQDQTPLAPLGSPTPPAQPRYISGFGLDNIYTIFYEDRHDKAGCPNTGPWEESPGVSSGSYIYYNQAINGPFGFSASSTKTNICDTHFLVKNWPITIGGTAYTYRGWGAVGNNAYHTFYVSNNLTNWTQVYFGTGMFSDPLNMMLGETINYGFHDIVKINGNYIGFAESAGGNTYIVWSDKGDENWTVKAKVGGSENTDGPLALSFTTAGPIPTGNFNLMEVGGQMVYGKLMVPGNRQGAYLAINAVAAQVAPALAEAAFMNPANWTWRDGTSWTAPGTANAVLTTMPAHTVSEVWTVPASDYRTDHVILYTASYGGTRGIGCAAGNAQCLIIDTTGPQVAASGINTVPDTGDGILTEFEVATVGLTKFTVTFNEDLVNVGSGNSQYGNSVINPANYMLVRDLGDTADFQTVSCAPPGAVVPADTKIDISGVTYDNSTHVATFTVNGGLPLSNGNYQLYVCGTTSITNLAGIKLAGKGTTAGTDFIRDFIVSIGGGGGGNNRDGRGKNSSKDPQIPTTSGLLIPVTGFTPNQVTLLPVQPAEIAYKQLDEIRIEIPTLGINFPIVGVSFTKNNWDLTWLNGKVGYLEGSAYPTFIGNTVLTAHVTEPNNNLGPFSDIKGMQLGQKIYIHAYGQVYVYQVQENRKIKPTDLSAVFKHEEYDWVTLVTCEDYNIKTKTYDYRRMVRAVLISVIPEK